jgi:CheY-like chemotaxis protein
MKKYILIVDDEADIRALLLEFLAASGYRVAGATSAAEALQSVREDKPDLVITDLQLEEADGLQMVSRLKVALPDTPVILLTGVLFDHDVVHGVLNKKVDCYLEKTSSLKQILEAIQRLLGQPGPA